MRETNPFTAFRPKGATTLVLGSFASKDAKKGVYYEWYYSNGRNHFWPILEELYGIRLTSKKEKQELFKKLSIAIADIIYQCDRERNSSLDVHLNNLAYNIDPIAKILRTCPIERILFTSKFVEKHFKKHFKDLVDAYPHIALIALPSPSPRYATLSKKEKAKEYKKFFPKL